MMASGHGVDRFVVLAGHDAAEVVAGCRSFSPTQVVTDPAGRPWILAELHSGRITVVRLGNRRLVAIGPSELSPTDQARLRRVLEGWSDGTEVGAHLPGTYHVVLHVDGRTRVQGTVSGIRRVYHCRFEGRTVVSDRANLLAQVIGSAVDEANLVVRMLEPVHHPLGDRTLFTGVFQVPADHWLETDDSGRCRTRCWWSPPSPVLNLHDGSAAVRTALTDAVQAHIRRRGPVFTELSGGYDSTAVTALALRAVDHAQDVTAVTVGDRGMNSDEAWARTAARDLGIREHRILSPDDLPLVYAEMLDADDDLDEPSAASASRATVRAMAAAAAGHDVHLTGHGGDHLFFGVPGTARDLLHRHPLAAIRRISAYRAMFGWPLTRVLAQLADQRSYGAWLRSTVGHVDGADIREPVLSWGSPTAVPPWFTPHARHLMTSAVNGAARTSTPRAQTRGQHAVIDGIMQGARLVRALSDISAGFGAPLAAPFFDDRVIEAALSVNLLDRTDPWSYKQVLGRAMQGVVPDAILGRVTKDTGVLEVELGVRRHLTDLRELWDDSRLAEWGLVDRARLIDLTGRPEAVEMNDGALVTTVACEVWLRSVERTATTRKRIHEHPHPR